MYAEHAEIRTQASTSNGLNVNAAHTEFLSGAQLCDHAVYTIWRNLDKKGLGNETARAALAAVLDHVPKTILPERLPRLIKTLRLPDPMDASILYWLTRRLLTVVPELQAAATTMACPERAVPQN